MKHRKVFAEILLPSLHTFVFITVFLGSLMIGNKMLSMDGDVGRHIAVGNTMIERRRVLKSDIFSHTMVGEEIIPHEWLAQVFFAALHRVGGMHGVIIGTSTIIGLSYMALFFAMSFRVPSPIAAMLSIYAAMAGSVHWLARPHIFTFLYFAIFLIVLERFRHNELGQGRVWQSLWPLWIVVVLWANTHGAFIVGLVLVGLYAGGAVISKDYRRAKALMICLGILVVMTMINPVGMRLVTHTFSYLGKDFLVDLTIEYRSPDFHNIGNYWPFLSLIVLSIFFPSQDKTCFILSAVWTSFALYSARNIPLYAMLQTTIIAPVFNDFIYDEAPIVLKHWINRGDAVDSQLSGWPWGVHEVAVVVLAALNIVPFAPQSYDFSSQVFPVQALENPEVVAVLEQGNVFNELTWGGYLLYDEAEIQVFIDGQTDYYGTELSALYWKTINAEPGWQSVLQSFDVEKIIIPPHRPLNTVLVCNEWERVYADETTVVWERTGH